MYSEETRQSIGAITSEYLNNESNGAFEFSTGLIYGETVTFEYYQPETVREEAIISISRIDTMDTDMSTVLILSEQDLLMTPATVR